MGNKENGFLNPSLKDVIIGYRDGYPEYKRPDGSTYVSIPSSVDEEATVTAFVARDHLGKPIRDTNGNLITGSTKEEMEAKRRRYVLDNPFHFNNLITRTWDPSLFSADVETFNAVTGGGLNLVSPTWWGRFAYNTVTGADPGLTGNSGLVSDKFAREHPWWTMAINGVADGATGYGLVKTFGLNSANLFADDAGKAVSKSSSNSGGRIIREIPTGRAPKGEIPSTGSMKLSTYSTPEKGFKYVRADLQTPEGFLILGENPANYIKSGYLTAKKYINHPVVQQTVENNRLLLERLLKQKSRNMGWFDQATGEFVPAKTRGEVLDHFINRPVRVRTKTLDKGVFGEYHRGAEPTMYISDQIRYIPSLKSTPFHEGLHHAGYGNFDGWIYDLKAEKLFGLSDDYLMRGDEAAANTAELGRRMGLKLGQKYPGLEKFKKMIEQHKLLDPEKGFILDKAILNKPADYGRLWKALTGKYFTAPAIVGGAALTQMQNDNQHYK